jgi:hypothetical protein
MAEIDRIRKKSASALLTLWRGLFFLLSSIVATPCHELEEVGFLSQPFIISKSMELCLLFI